ncbi:hypothetical protein BDY19DRAFT_951176 [Irpex rosettiformis]|uniref:Uncharacterized protein n=1 Tax=Irpex rosettiformis TaxID=378272 RepID=A0ACB8U1A0_9APHY|nr:hypothetical protein BDY19DRAFT_951176 [Irpex rosettiformis]
MDDILLSFDISGQEFETLPRLPLVWSPFSVPRLEEKPQNPIIETLRLGRVGKTKAYNTPPLASQDAPYPQENQDSVDFYGTSEAVSSEEDVWEQAVSLGDPHLDAITSWDTLRAPFPLQATPSCFLTQQPSHIVSAARHTINDSDSGDDFVTPDELLSCVQSMLKGIPSTLYIWEAETQTFRLHNAFGETDSKLIISGMNSITGESFARRFVKIGTLVRRLEILVTGVWQNSSRVEPAVHAFAHAVSSVLDHVKCVVVDITRSALQNSQTKGSHTLTSLWAACADVEEQLESMASLCNCGMDDPLSNDNFLSQSVTDILSRVFETLDTQFNCSSAREITATTAFILSSVSADYFDAVCHRVGYSRIGVHTSVDVLQSGHSAPFEDSDEDEVNELPDSDDEGNEDFPCFYQESLARALSNARRSLKLLRIARPDHPLLDSSGSHRIPIRWFWSEANIAKAWLRSEGMYSEPDPCFEDLPTKQAVAPTIPDVHYPSDFLEFKRFDLEPGSVIFEAGNDKPPSHIPRFNEFLDSFPNTLPSLTPSLYNLTDLVLAPLADHAEALSTALLDAFLSPSCAYLRFSSHLILLRSFLLLASPFLKSLLEGSLFSNNVGDFDIGMVPPRVSLNQKTITQSSWIIGLAPGLLAGSGWPPAGADLSFILRTVVFDALDHEYPSRQLGERRPASDDHGDESLIYDEAEWRLGFAVRDLPTGSGHAKWLNPRSIEALDFLYMSYQPPPALSVLITPNTLSKYHRLFVFNIRLLRVENVIKALFRMSSPGSDPLFQTITPSQKLFEFFRFMASSFVSTLSSYVYDVAIGSNFDTFLSKLGATHSSSASQESPPFSDVFSLAEGHSKLMDDVLSACLMRSAQKPVGDLLRSVLDVILDFGILMSDLKQGDIQEYQAAGPLENLCSSYRKKMITLVSFLRAIKYKLTAKHGIIGKGSKKSCG